MIKVLMQMKIDCDHKDCDKEQEFFGWIPYGRFMTQLDILDSVNKYGSSYWKLVDGKVLCGEHAEEAIYKEYLKQPR